MTLSARRKLEEGMKSLSQSLQVINFDYKPLDTFIVHEGDKIIMISEEIEGRVFYEFPKAFLINQDIMIEAIVMSNEYASIPIDSRNSKNIKEVGIIELNS